MKLYRMPLGALGTNCYIVVDESNQHCLVVDPGGEGERLVALLKEKGCNRKPLFSPMVTVTISVGYRPWWMHSKCPFTSIRAMKNF